jgi:hypothetical protein
MNKESQRIAIAEACGLKGIHVCEESGYYFGTLFAANGKPVPDYLNSLDAMHEAEKVIQDWWAYSDHLHEISYTQKPHDQDLIHSTAAQRAEAFLRTLGLWQDEDGDADNADDTNYMVPREPYPSI